MSKAHTFSIVASFLVNFLLGIRAYSEGEYLWVCAHFAVTLGLLWSYYSRRQRGIAKIEFLDDFVEIEQNGGRKLKISVSKILGAELKKTDAQWMKIIYVEGTVGRAKWLYRGRMKSELWIKSYGKLVGLSESVRIS